MLKFAIGIIFIAGFSIFSGCSSAPVKVEPTATTYTAAEAGYQLGAGVRQFNDKNYTAAIKHFKTALEVEPQNPVAHYELALTYMQLKRNEECIATAKNGLKNPENIKSSLTGILATCHSQAGNVKQAVRHYKSALTSSPYDPELHFNIAVAYSKLNNNLRAISHFEEAIKHKPEYATPYLALGEMYRTSNQRAMAMIYFMKFCLLESDTSRTRVAAKRIAYLPYSGIQSDASNKSVSLNLAEDSDLPSLDLALQLIAITVLPEDNKITAQDHVEVLGKFVAIFAEMAESNPDMKNTFFWEHAFSDIVKLHSDNKLLPFTHNLTDLAGFRQTI